MVRCITGILWKTFKNAVVCVRLMATGLEVKKANKFFYDTIAGEYEKIDVRRSRTTLNWVESRIKKLTRYGSNRLLDVGCGNGFVLRAARPHFRQVVGIDISERVLSPIKSECSSAVCGDAFKLPFKDDTFDVVSCFAVLHHCYTHAGLVREIYRVLKKKGVFYSDHDLDSRFMDNFYLLMKLYRFFFDFEQKYLENNNNITKRVYHLTEFHSEGVKAGRVLKALHNAGFETIVPKYHWMGLKDIVTIILCGLKITGLSRGWAPLFSVVARK